MKKRAILILLFTMVVFAGVWLVYNRYRVVIPAIDIDKSEIGWSGKSISDVHTGKIRLSKAELRYQGEMLIGGMFEADMRSITVTDITDIEDNRHFIEHIGNADFFEVDKYPVAYFVITKVTPIEDGTYEVTGNMKIRDKELPLTFKAKSETDDRIRRVSAIVSVDRTLFGIEYGAQGKKGSEKDWFILNEFVLNINIVAAKSEKM